MEEKKFVEILEAAAVLAITSGDVVPVSTSKYQDRLGKGYKQRFSSHDNGDGGAGKHVFYKHRAKNKAARQARKNNRHK